jgi:5-methylcytosine-specific restriction endonuclease McrA
MCKPCRARYNEAWYRAISVAGKQCHWCSEPATTKDHLVPLSRGGAHAPHNLVPACHACNSGRR